MTVSISSLISKIENNNNDRKKQPKMTSQNDSNLYVHNFTTKFFRIVKMIPIGINSIRNKILALDLWGLPNGNILLTDSRSEEKKEDIAEIKVHYFHYFFIFF